ncbi:MAG: hypothetical protein ACK5NT_03970 [Pyrinomonadaceae bacterium]
MVALITLSLALIGMLGWQLLYLAYMDRMGNERRKRIRELERYNTALYKRLIETEYRLRQAEELIESELGPDVANEVWADVIGDH